MSVFFYHPVVVIEKMEFFYLCFLFTINVIHASDFRAREALRQCLPDQLRDSTFSACLNEDKSTKNWLAQLIKNLEAVPASQQ